jgi:hypothetical protein
MTRAVYCRFSCHPESKALLKEQETLKVSLRAPDGSPGRGSLLLGRDYLRNGVCARTGGDRHGKLHLPRDDTR